MHASSLFTPRPRPGAAALLASTPTRLAGHALRASRVGRRQSIAPPVATPRPWLGVAAASDDTAWPEDEDSAATTFPALLAGLAVALDAAAPGDGGATARSFAEANPAVTSLEFVAWLAAA